MILQATCGNGPIVFKFLEGIYGIQFEAVAIAKTRLGRRPPFASSTATASLRVQKLGYDLFAVNRSLLLAELVL